MTVRRGLLWQAYPDGYLAMLGVSTIEGWICRWSAMGGRHAEFFLLETIEVDNDGYKHPRFREVLIGPGKAPVRGDPEAVMRGDLLPRLDPVDDPATWACALRDLATAVGWVPSRPPYTESLRFQFIDRVGGQLTRWLLSGCVRHPGVRGTGGNSGYDERWFTVDTDDPVEALCHVRASLRVTKE